MRYGIADLCVKFGANPFKNGGDNSAIFQWICTKFDIGRLTDFKMAAAAILDFCTMLILMTNLSARPYFQPMFQIRCKCVQ